MNKKIAVFLLSAVMMSVFSISLAASKEVQLEVLALKNGEHLIEQLEEDVNGDQIKDKIFLIGQREEEVRLFNRTIFVKVIDGETNKEIDVRFEDFSGYGGELFLGDFTGDQMADMMITANSGGSGGIINTRIASLKGNKVEIIFKGKDNRGLNFNGKLVDGFKAELTEDNFKKDITIDVSAFKDLYIESKIYDQKGKVLKKVEPWTDPFSALTPVDIDGDGVYELRGFQAISGAFHANRISNLESFWKYEDGKWSIKEAKYSTTLRFPSL